MSDTNEEGTQQAFFAKRAFAHGDVFYDLGAEVPAAVAVAIGEASADMAAMVLDLTPVEPVDNSAELAAALASASEAVGGGEPAGDEGGADDDGDRSRAVELIRAQKISDIMAAVEGDAELARQVFEAEQAAEEPRPTLLSQLAGVMEG